MMFGLNAGYAVSNRSDFDAGMRREQPGPASGMTSAPKRAGSSGVAAGGAGGVQSTSSWGGGTLLRRCLLLIPIILISQLSMHSYTSRWARDDGATGREASPIAFEALGQAADVERRGVAKPPVPTVECLHGGVEVGGGCICGRGTGGQQCEDMRVSREQVEEFDVCGPTCWPITVWYPTDAFSFRPLRPPGEDVADDAMRAMLEDVLAWRYGADPRGLQEEAWDMHKDPLLLEIMLSLGPWTAHDKHMLRALWEFREDERAGLVASPGGGSNGTTTTRIVFGLMLHDNVARFQALWDVLFNEEHYYIVHLDRGQGGSESEEVPASREDFLRVISRTPCRSGSVWDRVHVLSEEESLDTMWGDISLVYSEVLLWLHLLRRKDWEWDYFVNLSGADIPVMSLADMSAYLATRQPTSFLYHHENKDEFRQKYVMPAKRAAKDLVVFSALQTDFPYGQVRERLGMTRLTGNSQWHVLHRSLLRLLATEGNVYRLLFSYKHTSIPDESFFSVAALWAARTHPEVATGGIEGVDLRYWNEGFNRDLSARGELRAIKELSDNRQILFARKSNTAMVTCAYTNRLLGLSNDCTKYASTGVYPADAKQEVLPRREDPVIA